MWLRRFRLWKSRQYFGTPVGEWDINRNYVEARRLLPSGDYEYRPMTEDEAEDLFAFNAW